MNNAAANASDLGLVYDMISDGDIDVALSVAEELFAEGAIDAAELAKIESAAGAR